MCGLSECDLEASIMKRSPGPLGAVGPWGENKKLYKTSSDNKVVPT